MALSEAAPRLAIVGLGSNLGDRAAHLAAAAAHLAALPGVRLEAASPVYETAPVGGPAQGDFLNAAVRLRAALDPRALLERLLAVERAMGRERRERWGPRTIDLDLLHVEGVRCDEPGLTLPHPRLFERAFALAPALDVWPDAPAGWRAGLDALGGAPRAVWAPADAWVSSLPSGRIRTQSGRDDG